MSRMKMNLLFSAALMAAAAALPVSRAHADVRIVERSYVYYPGSEIYFAPDRNVWFWTSDGGQWMEGPVLPVIYQQYTYGGVPIVLREERPYVQHVTIVREHGGRKHPGKGKGHRKHKHKHKHHHD